MVLPRSKGRNGSKGRNVAGSGNSGYGNFGKKTSPQERGRFRKEVVGAYKPTKYYKIGSKNGDHFKRLYIQFVMKKSFFEGNHNYSQTAHSGKQNFWKWILDSNVWFGVWFEDLT
jgi:hypothetical protein